MKMLVRIPMLLALANFGLFAATLRAQGGEENFDQAKVMTLKMLEERIAGLQETKVCVQRARDRSDMKNCRVDAKTERKEMRHKIRDTRERLKAGQPERMQRKN